MLAGRGVDSRAAPCPQGVCDAPQSFLLTRVRRGRGREAAQQTRRHGDSTMAESNRSRDRERHKQAAAALPGPDLPTRGRTMPTPPLGAAGTPATSAPPTASLQPDIATVVAAVTNSQSTVSYRFNGVERCLIDHCAALQEAVGAVAALQRTQSAFEESVADLRARQSSHRDRLEAIEARLEARTATSPPAAQADTTTEVTSLAARLERLERERRTPPSHGTPLRPTIPDDPRPPDRPLRHESFYAPRRRQRPHAQGRNEPRSRGLRLPGRPSSWLILASRPGALHVARHALRWRPQHGHHARRHSPGLHSPRRM